MCFNTVVSADACKYSLFPVCQKSQYPRLSVPFGADVNIRDCIKEDIQYQLTGGNVGNDPEKQKPDSLAIQLDESAFICTAIFLHKELDPI